LVIIYISSEFLWFNIYGEHFNDQALTGFLGLMRILISVVQIAVIYGITRPLLKTAGVAQMNPVYPLTTLASFCGLLSHFGLSAAIGLHINGDALYKAINLPIHQLNYNAIPREFIGRIRALSDGFIYAMGLTLAGALLWIGETHLTLLQIAWLVSGLTGILLLVRLPMGRFYASGLEEMIRSNSINLDEFDTYAIPLSPQSGEAVRELLTDPDRYTQLKGLELATRMNQPGEFLTEVEALIPGADVQLYGSAIALFTDCPDLIDDFQERLQETDLQAFALEILLINHYRPNQAQIETWLQSSRNDLQVLGAIAQIIAQASEAPAWSVELDGATARIVTRIVAYSKNSVLTPLIPQVVLTQSSADVIRAGLEALLPLTQRGDDEVAALAQAKLSHPDPMVRIAAFNLLRVTRCRTQLTTIGNSLGDPDPRVRQQAANALAAYGRPGLAIAKESLTDSRPERVNTAITAIGLVRTKYASNLLFDYLTPSYKQLSQTRKWLQQIPTDDARWQPLIVAIADYHERVVQKVLYVLSALGHARTVNTVNRLLVLSDQSELENAIEVLASLNHRRFVMPLMPLLEARTTSTTENRLRQATPQWLRTKGYQLLLEALESKDRWIKTGALIALSTVPSALVKDPDPFVQKVASQIFGPINHSNLTTNTAMNQLLLLKNVALFKNLSLDELLLIDKSLEQTQVLSGETIFSEGDWGTHLFIVAEGSVQLIKTVEGVSRETTQIKQGQYFGEVALFDDAPRWDGAIAIEDCTLLKLGKNRFLSLVTQRPHIILEMCRFLSQRLREMDKHRTEQHHADRHSLVLPAANDASSKAFSN
ncbi:MAG: cyclic nucleotide-binding domain-containing protein, partial [Cyanobacteria bacterium P01_H01_bin.58]